MGLWYNVLIVLNRFWRLIMKKWILASCLVSAALAGFANAWDAVQLKGATDKENPVGYAVGEPIVFTLTASDVSADLATDGAELRWTRTGDDGKVARGTSPFRAGETCVVTTSLDRAGFVRLEAKVHDAKTGRPILRDKKSPGAQHWVNTKEVFFDGGAGVAVESIRQAKPEPADFDAFWASQKELLAAVPVTADLKPYKTIVGCKVYAVTIACAGPRPVTGFLFVPEDAAPKSCRARVAFQGYGFRIQKCPEWAAANCIAQKEIFLEINAHGYELGRDAAYYTEFGKGIRTPKYSYGFSPEENARPETAYFRGMALRVMRALQYMKTRPEWNGTDLIAEGGSQGGLQTSWAAGLDPDVTLARPSITWGCDYGATEPGGRLHGNWFIKYVPGLDYYDAINHIKRAKGKVEVTRAGLGDYTCPPSGLAAYYNAIPTPKSILWVQGSQHGVIPLQPNQTYTLSVSHQQTGEESKSQSASADVR